MAGPEDERNVPEPRQQGASREPREVVGEFFAGFARSELAYHPLFDKFGSEHVTLFLEQAHEQDIGELRLHKGNRWFRLIYVLVGVAVFGFLTWFLLPDQSELYLRILEYLGIFAAGTAGGYGLKAYQDSRRGS